MRKTKTNRIYTSLFLRDHWREVEATYTPATPGRMYLKNGDPGYPPEPEEIEIIEVDGIAVGDLTDDEIKEIEMEVAEAYDSGDDREYDEDAWNDQALRKFDL